MSVPSPQKLTAKIVVAGRLDDPSFHNAKVIGRYLAEEYSTVTVTTNGMIEADWEQFVRQKGKKLGGAAFDHKLSPLVYFNDTKYIGGLQEFVRWAGLTFGYKGKANPILYSKMAYAAYREYLENPMKTFVYFDVRQGEGSTNRVVMELDKKLCPRTTDNFRALCTGEKGTEDGVALSYAGTPFHRVSPDGWVQGGDVEGGHGDGGRSIYGKTFEDENFAIPHDVSGVISMANSGSPHTNASQFVISLVPARWMDKKYVAFGRVISGLRALRIISKSPTLNERPRTEAVIDAAGEFNYSVWKAGHSKSTKEISESKEQRAYFVYSCK